MPQVDDEFRDELNKIKNNINKDYFSLDQQRDWSNTDMRFCDIDGAMYEDWFRDQFEDRPKMEFNKVAQAVHRFVGEWASNRFETKFLPDGGDTSEADAELLSGMYRKDFRRSSGAESIDNAVTEMAKGGFGALRLSTEFVDEEDIENDQQRVIFEPIFSAYSSVIFDSNAKKYDKSDGKRATYLEQMVLKAAQEEWGEEAISSAFEPPDQNRFNWRNDSRIWIAHYYEIREDKQEVIVFQDPFGKRKAVFKDEFKDHLDELADAGFEEISRRKKKRFTVWKTIVSGNSILEPARRIPGKLIPLIPMYGFRSYVDGKEWWYGIVRKLKDANRLFNMGATSVAEVAATTSKDMPIFTDEQVEGRETQLSEMHLGPYNYAVINQLYDDNGQMVPAGPVGNWQSSKVDPNSAAVMQLSADFIQQESGGAPQDVIDVEASGKAINAAISRQDMNTFVLMDNIAKTLKRVGEVYRSIAGEIYDVERAITTVQVDGTEKQQQLFEVVVDEKTGKPKAINDVTKGVFEVVVDTGPAFASRKRETLETIKDIMTITPPESPYFPFLYSEIINNIDGVGLDELREFNSRQMLMMGLRQPENEEEQQILQAQQAQQTNEENEYLQALAQREQAEAQESLSNIEKNASQAQLNLAKAAETIAGIDISRFKAANDAAESRAERAARGAIAFQQAGQGR